MLIADQSLCGSASVIRDYEAPGTKGLRRNRWRYERSSTAIRQTHFHVHFWPSNRRSTLLNICKNMYAGGGRGRGQRKIDMASGSVRSRKTNTTPISVSPRFAICCLLCSWLWTPRWLLVAVDDPLCGIDICIFMLNVYGVKVLGGGPLVATAKGQV